MNSETQTRGQLERTLSQRIQALYRTQLGQQPSRVQCQIFDGKIVIILEDSITKTEQVLVASGQEELAEQVRDDLDKAFNPQLTELIQEVVGIEVIDVLTDATLKTGRTGTIAVLADVPLFREPQAPRKSKSDTDLDDAE
ncbi:DUF2294 domain-containing protein [Phormidesmis priestleyi]|uniref:DUF2294 domain-containing protein n=1 Tax=Phormidesmis priestleyi TaxID=268141 RepID=UPI00083B4729|nr:DUF2294 domain-containing protein [Phormidesmis priestleyi]